MTIWKAVAAAMLVLGFASGAVPGDVAAARTPAVVRHPVSGLPVVRLAVTSGHKVHTFRVEVARTTQEQATGLMFRSVMGADEGMIFPMQPPREASFWMHNTVLPLDIVYVGPDGRIITIAANAVPYDDTPIGSGGPVKGVLELNAGRAAALGIKVGDKVRW